MLRFTSLMAVAAGLLLQAAVAGAFSESYRLS